MPLALRALTTQPPVYSHYTTLPHNSKQLSQATSYLTVSVKKQTPKAP